MTMHYTNSAKIEAGLSDLISAAELIRLFDITPVTLYQWRSAREHPLPTVSIPGDKRPSIRFYRPDVLAWAAREGVPIEGRVPRLPPAKTQRVARVAREQVAA